MNWKKLSKPLEELGKWNLNAGLAIFVATLLQPLVKGEKSLSVLGILAVIVANGVGFGLIFLSELLKGED